MTAPLRSLWADASLRRLLPAVLSLVIASAVRVLLRCLNIFNESYFSVGWQHHGWATSSRRTPT